MQGRHFKSDKNHVRLNVSKQWIIFSSMRLSEWPENKSLTSNCRGVYPYLPMATNAPWSILRGDKQKGLILNFNIQKCEFCAQIQIHNLQFTVSEIWFWCFWDYRGRPSPKTHILFAGASTHRSIDSACVLEKNGEQKNVHIFIKIDGKIKGRKIKLLKHVFALYSLPIIFSKIFLLATLARLRFIPHFKKCKHAMCCTN